MVTLFEISDLISFGRYLLSEEREGYLKESSSKIPYEERFRNVSYADIENWKDKINEEALFTSEKTTGS
jgi:hypothetical protein